MFFLGVVISYREPQAFSHESIPFATLQEQFKSTQQPLLTEYCFGCHSTTENQGELDLQQFRSVDDMRHNAAPWQRVIEMLDDGEMPPKDAKRQPTKREVDSIRSWVRSLLDAIALSNSGDPGPVVLRRLNNAEYTYTIQDLTGVSLHPTREFPSDSAAGEGFTNVGSALVISPALIQKYLDAAKEISKHAMLLPTGITFSENNTRRDWTNEKLGAIQKYYAKFTDSGGATAVNLQGIQFDTNAGGRLPLEKYLRATLIDGEALVAGTKTIAMVAVEHALNEKYLLVLWDTLNDNTPSLVLDIIRTKWRTAKPNELDDLIATILQWQKSLWRFATIGHIGKRDGPSAWQVPIHPLAASHEIRTKLPKPQDGKDIILYLFTSDLADGNEHDFAVWENPRFLAPGKPELHLRDLRNAVALLSSNRQAVLSKAAACLDATAEFAKALEKESVEELALKHDVDPSVLSSWFQYLGIGAGEARIDSLAAKSVVPAGSLLEKWLAELDLTTKQSLAIEMQSLLARAPDSIPKDSPDAALYSQLTSLSGPLFSQFRTELLANKASPVNVKDSTFGVDPSWFGLHPNGEPTNVSNLVVKAPSILEVIVPADLVEGYEFVATGSLHPGTGAEGTVQLQVLFERPSQLHGLAASGSSVKGDKSTWSDGDRPVKYDTPIIVDDNSDSKKKLMSQFDAFRQVFPAALCYTKIVPVDEVVTLTLYYREDDQLKRLMLDDGQIAELDKLWEELHFVSQDALALIDAYEQLWQFATQDADPSAFTPMREGIMQRAEQFRIRLLEAEPGHIQFVLDLAERSWRRPLSSTERQQLKELYSKLRNEELSHDVAIRLLISRVLVAPAFLYRGEEAANGEVPTLVTAHELATRLSYFLWSTMPDQELLGLADNGTLYNSDVFRNQVRRMMSDERMRRMAIEFGCQWLHVRDFDRLDEKSEKHFPEFTALKADMYEETIRFFDNMFRSDGSVLDLLIADHTFVNGRLANFYGLGHVEDGWQRIDGTRTFSRGGILSMATTMAKHSGASRTSPILRGNWVSEFLLGEKLPRPPKDVPVLAEDVPMDLTERQLVERHSNDPACAKCHQRIDGFGFALEQYDTIGRLRSHDAQGHKIETDGVLRDGTHIAGVEGLREYLATNRREDFLRTFCKRLLGYALGRSVQLSDKPLIDEMVKQLNAHEFRFSVAVETIVLSPQFRMMRGADHRP